MQPTRSVTFRPDFAPLPSLRLGSVGEHCRAATSVARVATPPPSGEAPESPRTNLKVSGKRSTPCEAWDVINKNNKKLFTTRANNAVFEQKWLEP